MTRTATFGVVAALLCACTATQPRFEGSAGSVVRPDAGTRACADAGTVLDDNPCACPTDCAPGATCTSESFKGFAGGSCVRACLLPDAGAVGMATACTANAECVELGEGLGACQQRCTTSSDCPRGRICGEGVCFAFCTADAQCDSKRCRSNQCVTEEPKGAGAFEPCLRRDDCKSQLCSAKWRRCAEYCSIARQDCAPGMVCVAEAEDALDLGLCMPECAPNRPCADPTLACQWAGRPYGTYACTPRRSAPCRGAPLTVSVGGPCGCDSDCTTEGSCAEEVSGGAPGGFCIDECRTSADCPSAFLCEGATPTERGWCRLRCVTDANCGAGRYCVNGSCAAFCDSNADCTNGRLCTPHRNRCVATLPTGSATGDPCRQSSECKSRLCSSDPGQPGVCIQTCKIAEQTCPDGATCLGDSPNENAGLCYPPCTPGSRCDDPAMECLPSIFPVGQGTFCRYR